MTAPSWSAPPPLKPWTSDELQRSLTRQCRELAQQLDLGAVAISLFRATDELEVVAVSGRGATDHALVGHRTPTPTALALLGLAEQWGELRFVPHDDALRILGAGEIWVGDGVVPAQEVKEEDDAWLPYDLLLLPLYDGDELVGILGLDQPGDGRRPSAEQRQEMEAVALDAGRVVVALVTRIRIEQQVRLAQTVSRFAREASAHLDLESVLITARTALREGFGAEDLDVSIDDFPEHDLPSAGADFVSVARRVAMSCWEADRVEVVSVRSVTSPLLTRDEQEAVRANLVQRGLSSVLVAPIGAGPECLGRIVMRRRVGQPDWSDEEAEAARAIGQDLGDAVLTARSYLRQQELGDYKGRLITAVSHELRQPISAMLGHLAVLAETVDELDPDDPTYAPLSSTTRRIGRAAERLSGIVTDLLSLSLVEGEESATPRTPVDLGEVVHGAVELLSIRALHGQVTLTESSNADVSVLGDAAELERLMINLVGNAVKYTAAGGTVAVSCTAEGDEAIVTITDTGIGISADDLAHLFEEFYRANDVEARRREGTGLGLAIVARIVERHHGRISAASIHGEGSTFTVTLPLAPPG